MSSFRRPFGSWLVVASLGVSALLAVPAFSWAQAPGGNPKPQMLRLEVGHTVWVTEAPQLEAEKKTGAGINRSWDVLVGSVKAGKKVNVTLMSSSDVEGKLLAIDAGSITVERSGAPRVIAAADVLRVRYANIRQRHVLYGMLIGAVAGGVAFWAADKASSSPDPYESGADIGAIVIGLPLGAVVGAALPIGPPLYEAAQAAGQTR